MILLNEEEAVELLGGAASEREKLERGGEEWELLEEEEVCGWVCMAWQEAVSQDSLPPPDGYFGPN